MKKILFLSHDASRTGAPRSLLLFLQWLRKTTSEIEFCLLFKDGGILQRETEDLGFIGTFNLTQGSKPSTVNKIFRKFGFYPIEQKRHLKNLKNRLLSEDIDLIYANTIANGEVLEFLLEFMDCPVVCHVRELEQMISNHVGQYIFAKTQKYTDRYIAVSYAVKDNLIENHGISEDKIDVIYNFIPDDCLQSREQFHVREQILKNLNIPVDAKVVCASGTIDWRKGPDLFIQLARSVIQKYFTDKIRFIWVGGCAYGTQFSQLKHDIIRAGLSDKIHFVGSVSNPLDYYAACDVFALVSREDPFPRVCLESAALGKPILCFENAGGEPEFVESDCGFILPYLDIEGMANKTICLLENAGLREKMGNRAMQKAKENHNPNRIGQQILDAIDKTF